MQLNYDWLLVAGTVRVLLPKGSAQVAGMRFYGVGRITSEPAKHFDGRFVTFGEVVIGEPGAEEEHPRHLVLDHTTGRVGVRDTAESGDADSFAPINASMDEFLTSLAAFEMWHGQIVESDQPEVTLEQALRQLARIDPDFNRGGPSWWAAALREVADAW